MLPTRRQRMPVPLQQDEPCSMLKLSANFLLQFHHLFQLVWNTIRKLSLSAVFLGSLIQKHGKYLQQGWPLELPFTSLETKRAQVENKEKQARFKNPRSRCLQTDKHPPCVNPTKQVNAFHSHVHCANFWCLCIGHCDLKLCLWVRWVSNTSDQLDWAMLSWWAQQKPDTK